MQTKQFDYKGKKISYRLKGEGPLLVLLHGFGEDGNVWAEQFDIFPQYQLLVPDLPGSGESEMTEDMSMEGMADVVKALVADLSPSMQSFTMISHSMGGYITLAFVEKYPDALNAFGLFHSTAFADTEEKKETRHKGIAFIEQHGGFEFLKTATPNLFAPATKTEKPELVEKQINALRNADGAALVRYYRSMMERPDRKAVLKNSNVPVLFVMGRHDNAVPVEDGLKQCHLPQLTYIELLENSGHMGMIEEPELTNAILKNFMASLHK